MNVFSRIYLALGLAVLVVELYGAFKPTKMDTISEHWWWIQDRLPLRAGEILMTLFLAWLWVHFITRGAV